MKRIIIIIIIILVVIVLGLTVYMLFQPKETATSSQSSEVVDINFTNQDKMILKTSQGDVLSNDIYTKPIRTIGTGGVIFAESELYNMGYYPQQQQFYIAILSPEINLARTNLEKDFLEKLGISAGDACKLNVTVNVSSGIDPLLAGKNLGLSFCPGSYPMQ